MKTINSYILEKLKIDKETLDKQDYQYIDKMPTGKQKSEEIFNILTEKYKDMFDEMRLMRSGNIKLGKITNEYKIPDGRYNTSEFTFYIYEDSYLIRRTELNVTYTIHPVKFVEFPSLRETLEKFDMLLTKRKYTLPK